MFATIKPRPCEKPLAVKTTVCSMQSEHVFPSFATDVTCLVGTAVTPFSARSPNQPVPAANLSGAGDVEQESTLYCGARFGHFRLINVWGTVRREMSGKRGGIGLLSTLLL